MICHSSTFWGPGLVFSWWVDHSPLVGHRWLVGHLGVGVGEGGGSCEAGLFSNSSKCSICLFFLPSLSGIDFLPCSLPVSGFPNFSDSFLMGVYISMDFLVSRLFCFCCQNVHLSTFASLYAVLGSLASMRIFFVGPGFSCSCITVVDFCLFSFSLLDLLGGLS